MLVLLQDLLTPFAKNLFLVITREAAKKAGRSVLPQMAHDELEAFIESFFGEQFRTYLIAIREELEDAVQEITSGLQKEILRQSAQSQYRDILQKLHGIGEKCKNYQEHPENPIAQNEFITVCKNDCPANILSWLSLLLTSKNHATGDFLENISLTCNYIQFIEWRNHLNAISGLASFYRTLLLDLKLWKAQENGLNIDQDMDIAAKEIKKMLVCVDQIRQTLARKCTEKKWDFLQPCGDKSHKRCSGKQEEHCTLLSERLFKFLKDSKDRPSSANAEIARKLATHLKEAYSWYEWTVLVSQSGNVTEEFYFHRDFDRNKFDELRVQYLGETKRPWAIFAPDKFHVAGILSKGTLYGQMTCHYTSSFSSTTRAIQVFWAEDSQIQRTLELPAELLTKLEAIKHPHSYTKDSLTDFQGNLKKILLKHGYDYTFVQTAPKTGEPKDSLGIHLLQRKDKTWPLHLEDERGHTFMWPCKSAFAASSHVQGLVSGGSTEKPRTSIIVAGGLNINDEYCTTVECYDSERSLWKDVGEMPYLVSHADATDIDDILYVVGGHNGKSTLDSSMRFIFARGQWNQDIPRMKQPRWNHSIVGHNRVVYALGGLNQKNQCLRSVEMWDPRTDKWSAVQSMRSPRSKFAAACVNDQIFVVCGAKDNGSVISSCEVFDPRNNRWEYISSPSNARADHSCAVISGDLYLIGGWQTNGSDRKTQSSCERYICADKKWTSATGMSRARDGSAAVVSALDNRLYVVGGRSHNCGAIDSVEQYDPVNRIWAQEKPMMTPRRFHIASSVPLIFEGLR